MEAIDTRALDQLQELIGGDQDSLFELINTFLDEGKGIVADMQRSLVEKDLELLRRSAHSLKSSAQDFGAVKLSELCASLESASKTEWPGPDQSPENSRAQIDAIAEHFEISAVSLRNYIS